MIKWRKGAERRKDHEREDEEEEDRDKEGDGEDYYRGVRVKFVLQVVAENVNVMETTLCSAQNGF